MIRVILALMCILVVVKPFLMESPLWSDWAWASAAGFMLGGLLDFMLNRERYVDPTTGQLHHRKEDDDDV
jgi:hypothetical protein